MIYLKAAIITILVVAALLAITSLIALLYPVMVIGGLFLGILFILRVNNPIDKSDKGL